MEDIYRRLKSLPAELRAARAHEYECLCRWKRAQYNVEFEEASFMLVNEPDGRNAETRQRQATVLLAADPSCAGKRAERDMAEQDLEVARQGAKMLEDEYSSLRNIVRLMVGQMMLAASGVQAQDVPVVDRWLDREANHGM